MSVVKDFKKFISRGNVLDMAVGVIIGGAFQSIINSLVKDCLMPFLSIITGGVDFTEWKWVLKEAVLDAEGAVTKAEVAVNYGNLINAILNFLLMALAIFFLIRLVNKAKDATKKPEAPAAPAAPTTKICPFCKSEIAIDAVRCPHCTSELPEEK